MASSRFEADALADHYGADPARVDVVPPWVDLTMFTPGRTDRARLGLPVDAKVLLFVNAMTTVSGVVFIYGPKTELASISVLNMDDTGEIASAAAMAMMIFYTNVAARGLHLILARWLERRTQA